MRLLCAYCRAEIFLDLSNDKVAKAELVMYQSLPCNPLKGDKNHKFSVIQ